MVKDFFIKKIVPLILAIFIGYWFYSTYSKRLKTIELNTGHHFSNYDADFALESVTSALKSENTIVLFGSSELNTSATHYNARADFFFRKYNTSLSLITLGHAGNQSFSIFTQLLALKDYINNSKISIIVSPGWFSNGYEKGTSLQSFLEFNKTSFLRSVYENENDSLKNYVFQYINKKYNDIEDPGKIFQLIHDYQSQDYGKLKKIFHYPIRKYNQFIDLIDIPTMEDEMDYWVDFDKEKTEKKTNINWDSLYNGSIKHQEDASSNNNWYINNKYYSKYTKGIKSHHTIPEISEMPEFQDFKMLLYLLDYYNVDASFIIPPLNPYAYDNLINFVPILTKIENEIEKYNFPYNNMFVYDTTNYTPGLLTDVMHQGEYGWFKIDKFLIDTYENK